MLEIHQGQISKGEEIMFTPKFMEGAKNSLMTMRNFSYEAEAALDIGDIHEAQRVMASMVGHAINAQAVLAAKIAYELSKAEAKEEI